MKTERKKNETDLTYDERQGSWYWLGPVVRVHRIGEYQFLEHRRLKRDGINITNKVDYDHPNEFSCYIHERSIGRGASSLDEALVTVIAYKRDGCNSRAASYFLKMTEPEPEEPPTAPAPPEKSK